MLYIALLLFWLVRASIAAAAPRRQLILSSSLYHVSEIDHSAHVFYGNVDADGFGNKLDSLHTELERCRDVAIALAAPRERSHLQREHAMRHAYHGGSHGPSTAPRAATAAADAAAAEAAAPAPRATAAGVAAGRRAPKLLKAVSKGAVAPEPLFHSVICDLALFHFNVPNVAGRNESVYLEFPVTNAGNNTLLPSPWLDARQLRRSRRVVSPFEVFEVAGAAAAAAAAAAAGGARRGVGIHGYGKSDDGVTKASGSLAPSVLLLRFLSVVGDTPAAAPDIAEAAAVAAAHSDWRRLLLSKCTPQAALIVTNNVSKAEDSVRTLLARRADGSSGVGGSSNGLNNVTGLRTSKARIVLFEPPEERRWSATRLLNYTLELSRFIQYHLLEMERDAGAAVGRDGVIRQCVAVLVYGGERAYVPWNEVNAPWWKIKPLLRQRAAALLSSQYENGQRMRSGGGGAGGRGGFRDGGTLVEKADYGCETDVSSASDGKFGPKKCVAVEANDFFATLHFLGVRNYEYQLVFSTAGEERLRDTLRLADDHLLICAEDLAWWRWVNVKVVARSVKLHLHSINFTNPTGGKQAIYLATSPKLNIGCALLRLAAELSKFAVVYFSEGAALPGHGCTDEQLLNILKRNGEIGPHNSSDAALWRARNVSLQMRLSLINSLILDYTVGSSAQGAFFGTFNASTLYQQMRSNMPIIGLNDVIPVEFGTYFRRERYAPMTYSQFAAATAAYRAEREAMTNDERRMHEVEMKLLRREAYRLTRKAWKEAFGGSLFSHI